MSFDFIIFFLCYIIGILLWTCEPLSNLHKLQEPIQIDFEHACLLFTSLYLLQFIIKSSLGDDGTVLDLCIGFQVRWMMYWIVFALVITAELFADLLLGFW